MRLSSSTTSRCGASSGSATAGPIIMSLPTSRSARPPRAIGLGNKTQHVVAAPSVDHGGEEGTRRLVRVGPEPGQSARDAFGLQAGELHGERFALRRDEQEAVAPVVWSLLLQHIALIHELLEHAPERLFGDAQSLQEIGDLHSGIAIDEMQHPVVRSPEPKLLEHVIGVGDEVPVGKEQKLDKVPDRLTLRASRELVVRCRTARSSRKNYVSHVDIFSIDCY